jgi:hypothetical protein
VQSLPKHPQKQPAGCFFMALARHLSRRYLAATAIKIKAHCAFHSWISAIKPSEID